MERSTEDWECLTWDKRQVGAAPNPLCSLNRYSLCTRRKPSSSVQTGGFLLEFSMVQWSSEWWLLVTKSTGSITEMLQVPIKEFCTNSLAKGTAGI